MMNPSRRRQRGEGKIGCIVSFVILAVMAATAIKAVPVYWNNNELKDAAKDLASRASVVPVEAIELQLRAKARDLGIVQAMAPGAIKASKRGDGLQGTCSIRLLYEVKIDLYGVYQWTVVTKDDISAPYMSGL